MKGEQLLATNISRAGEVPKSTRPRIFVASLGALIDGDLEGAWFDADVSAAELLSKAAGLLGDEPNEPPHEHLIYAHENFAGYELSQSAPLSLVADVARGIRDHGSAFAHWARLVENRTEFLADFKNHYFGYWPSPTYWAASFLKDLGIEQELYAITPGFQPYICVDYDKFARDMAANGEVTWSEDAGGIHVFLTPWRLGATNGLSQSAVEADHLRPPARGP